MRGSGKVEPVVDGGNEDKYARAQARWKDDTRARDKMRRYQQELAERRQTDKRTTHCTP